MNFVFGSYLQDSYIRALNILDSVHEMYIDFTMTHVILNQRTNCGSKNCSIFYFGVFSGRKKPYLVVCEVSSEKKIPRSIHQAFLRYHYSLQKSVQMGFLEYVILLYTLWETIPRKTKNDHHKVPFDHDEFSYAAAYNIHAKLARN